MGKKLTVAIILLVIGFLCGVITRYFIDYRRTIETITLSFNKTNTNMENCISSKTFTTVIIQTITTVIKDSPNKQFNVYLLENKEYYGKIMEIISRANYSVYVIMFIIKYDVNEPDDPVNQLLTMLVNLYEKGVDVKVLVDDETYNSYPETIEFLISNGISVKLDPRSGITTHTKMVIVDGMYVFIGSHNWTESALNYNNEVSALIISQEIAQEALTYFSSLWNQGRTLG